MSERDGYEPGVPCFVDTWQPDAEAAVGFYSGVFGWLPVETPAPEGGRHFMLRHRDGDVAAIGGPTPAGATSAWNTYVWVADVDETAAAAEAAGGTVLVPPFGSLDGGRMAILADPQGATFGVWAPGAHRGAERVNEPSAWSMSMLHTPDPGAALGFYGALFGWQGTLTFGPATMFQLPGYLGGEPSQPVPRDVVAVMAPAAPGEPARWAVDFWTDDAERVAARAAELGGGVIAGPYDQPPFRQAVLRDPSGATFSVSELRPAT